MVKSKISKTKISKTKNSRTSRKIRKGGGNPTPEECCEIDSQNLGKKHKNTFTRCFNATFKLNNSENEYLSPEDKIRVESSNKKNLIRKIQAGCSVYIPTVSIILLIFYLCLHQLIV